MSSEASPSPKRKKFLFYLIGFLLLYLLLVIGGVTHNTVLIRIPLFILIFTSIMSFFWILIGLPTAIVLGLIVHFSKSDDKTKLKKALHWSLGGVPLLLVTLLMFFLFGATMNFLGINPKNIELPTVNNDLSKYPANTNAVVSTMPEQKNVGETFMQSCNADGTSQAYCTCALQYIDTHYNADEKSKMQPYVMTAIADAAHACDAQKPHKQ